MSENSASFGRRLVAEALGTGLLLATVIGSGIMGSRLAGGNVAIALLANTLATGAGLVALILTFGPVSGAHFNPVVTLCEARAGRFSRSEVAAYLAAQFAGAFAGVAAAHLMFGEPVFSLATHARPGAPQLWSECVATFALDQYGHPRVLALPGPAMTSFAVGAVITAAYWFTASTSFPRTRR